jgi:hypothetical protein
MINDILKRLRGICKLIQMLDRAGGPEPKVRRFARVYGPTRLIKLQVWVRVAPIYPDHNGYDPGLVVGAKPYRLKLARLLEDEITNILVGYKVEVRIEK